MRALFHITTAQELEAARPAGEYRPTAFPVEGFVHCSYAHQVVRVANLRFRGREGLVLLELDPGALDAPVVEENLEGGQELFPHCYGPLPLASVRRVHPFACDAAGDFQLPPGIPLEADHPGEPGQS